MARKKKIGIGQYISGKILANEDFIRRLPVLAYLGLLTMIYMANNFRIQAKYEYMDKISNEISTLRTISVTTTEQRMARSSQKEVEKLIDQFNLKLETTLEQPSIIE